jgi:hypothetical protein
MRNRPSLALVLCVLLAALLAAVCTVWSAPARAALGTCSISGTVTAPSVSPVHWVEVTAYDATGAQVAQTVVSGGAYALTGLSQGAYRLLFHDTQPSRLRDRYYGGGTTLAGAAVITLSAEGQVAAADVTLEPWGVVQGYVTGQNSGSVPGASVRLLGAAGQFVAPATCNEHGRFEFAELELGTYYVAADAGPLSLGAFYPSVISLAEATPVTLTREAPTTQLDIRVLERSGMPIGAAARPDGRQDLPAELFAVPHSLASDGTTVVAGERWSDSALVYAHTEAGWRLQGRLTPQVKDEYTCGLIQDVDGDTIAISEYVPSTSPGTVGRIWIYRRVDGAWTLEQRLAPSGSAYRSFGASVAISGDTLLVGAPEATVGDSIFAGVVYVYTRSGTRWTQRAKLRCDETNEGGTFGDAIDLQGSTAAIAASQMDWGGNNNAGQVFVFTGSGADWDQRAALRPRDGLSCLDFGQTVALDHGTVAIGAWKSPDSGAVYVFTGKGDSWTQQARLTPSDGNGHMGLGYRLALGGDTIIATTLWPAAQPAGYAAGTGYVFNRTGETWRQEAQLRAPAGESASTVGQSVAVAGGDLLVGSTDVWPNTLRVYHPYVTGLGQPLEVPAPNGVLANDSSSAGQAMTAALAAGPEHGSLDVHADGSFTYTPDEGWAGDDTFTYLASDGTWTSDPTTVTVTTRDPNAPNVAAEDTPKGWVNSPVTVTLAASDDTQVRQVDYRRHAVRRWSRYDEPFTVSEQGATRYDLRAVDVFGNASRTGSLTVKVDTKAPVPRIPHPVTVARGRTALIKYVIADRRPGSPRADVQIRVQGHGQEPPIMMLPGRPVGKLLTCKYWCRLPRGRYTILVTAVDAAGNLAKKRARSTLTVR